MRDKDRRGAREESEPAAVDPVALTLALWLGLVVSVAAVTRLSQDAAAQAALRQDQAQTARAAAFSPTAGSYYRSSRFQAYGG